jgi:hypothetical protein
MVKISEASTEMSKRVDGVESMLWTLSDRLYDSDKTQGNVVISVEKVTDQLSVIFEKLKSNDEKIKEIEETITPIKLVKSHWKLIMWLGVASSSLGFAFDGGVKNIAHAIDKYKISSITQNVIRNERNG